MASSDRQELEFLGTQSLMQGIYLYGNKQYEKAAEHFKNAAEHKNPEAINYLYILGQHYLRNGDYVHALPLLFQASYDGRGLRLMSEEPPKEERNNLKANTVYLYKKPPDGKLKYVVKGIQEEQDVTDLKEEDRAVIEALFQRNPRPKEVLYLSKSSEQDTNEKQALQLIFDITSKRGHILYNHQEAERMARSLDNLYLAAYAKAQKYYTDKQYKQAGVYCYFLLDHPRCFKTLNHTQSRKVMKIVYELGFHTSGSADKGTVRSCIEKASQYLNSLLDHLLLLEDEGSLTVDKRSETLYQLGLLAYAASDMEEAVRYFKLLLEGYKEHLNDNQLNDVIYHLGLIAYVSSDIQMAWTYFHTAALQGHELAINYAAKLIYYLYCAQEDKKPTIAYIKDTLQAKIQHQLRECLPHRPRTLEVEHDTAAEYEHSVKEEKHPVDIKQSEALQREYEIQTVLSRTNDQNKRNSQASILAQFHQTTSIHSQNKLFSFLEENKEGKLAVLNTHTNPWIDAVFGIEFTASYSNMLYQIRLNAYDQLCRELEKMESLEYKQRLLSEAKRMKIFYAPIGNFGFDFFRPNTVLEQIDEQIADIRRLATNTQLRSRRRGASE